MNSTIYFSQNQKQFQPADLLALLDPIKFPKFEAFKRFLEYGYQRTKGNEFWQASLEQIKNEWLALWNFLQKRQPKETQIKIFNPDKEKDGFSSENTLILINQDDVPFIVDSLQIALNKLNVSSLPILSIGGLCTVRNNDGELLDIIVEDQHLTECFFEDPILIHLNKQFDQSKLVDIENYLHEVLKETHSAQVDQSLMREKCQAIIDELTEHRRHLPSEEAREATTFLKWLLEDHFYFLGYREYRFDEKKADPTIDLISGSGLGLLRDETRASKSRSLHSMPAEAQRLATSHNILVITKTNTKSRVHRDTYTDYISIKRFDKEGHITGEYRFIGLFPHSAYNESIKQIPYLRQKANAVMSMIKVSATGHLGKSVLNILENFPRDDIFQIRPEELHQITTSILSIQERRVTRLLIRKDAYGRFYSCLVYVPREKMTAELASKIGSILLTKLQGSEISMSMQLDTSALGRLHYVIRIPASLREQVEIDFNKLEEHIIEASKSWKERFKDLLDTSYPEYKSLEIFQRYQDAFNAAYQEDFGAQEVLNDIQYIEEIYQNNTLAIKLNESEKNTLGFKLFQLDQPTTLSDIIPILENMGLEAIEENAYKCKLEGKIIWICHYHLRIRDNPNPDLTVIAPLFRDLFFAVWHKKVENDRLNALVLKCGLPWHLVAVLRAYCCYLKLISTYSHAYLVTVLNNNFQISKQLLQLFAYRFRLEQSFETEAITLKAEIKKSLAEVTNLEEDKILRSFLALMDATLRTNYYQTDENGNPKNYLSFKLQSGKIPNLPLPHPLYEIFVYSTAFEGIHLRAGKVARGGIRWSDRLEDFRTEVLGLMKAQQVKNAVIVPSGSKGGFVLKNITGKMDRNQIQDEAIACYQNYMRGLLDITDNLVDGKVVHPAQVKIYDNDDPYLVVAADKGTATFSDYANAVAAEYNFWLGDAFASGGSNGYDHKKMAITAKGAWISVETHLKALGINPSEDPFTVVGIGDMSGDVFGNGMLLSNKIKLVAAFNHMHIFIDPNPECASSFAERKRLFELPRSNWADYDTKLISKGGGIFERSAKSILLTEEIKNLFGLTEDQVEPNVLIQAILQAPVDLLFNGGIGTYVKSSSERNNEVGDKNNDGVRVNANELKCKAVGEGGNLGFTQLGRVEYAQCGGLIFTDFIDNSAGVDLSDHEVNIKILLNQAINESQLDLIQRNVLLGKMADEVKTLVLKDNKDQTEALSYAAAQAGEDLEIHVRCINQFEQQGILNRSVEFLPSEHALEERLKIGKGLTAPEIAIIMAYVKMDIKQAILRSNVADTEFFKKLVELEFPQILNEKYHDLMEKHQLHREIISTQLTNQLINAAGILFVQRVREETNARIPQIIRAYSVIMNVFELPHLYAAIRSLDFQVEQEIQNHMRKYLIRFLRRATRWLIRHHLPEENIVATIEQLEPIKPMLSKLPEFFVGVGRERYDQLLSRLIDAHVPPNIATSIAQTYFGFLLLEINALSQDLALPLHDVGAAYFELGKQLGLDWLRNEITNSPVANKWEALAHSSFRDKLDHLQSRITRHALKQSGDIDQWLNEKGAAQYEAWQNILAQLRSASKTDYVMFSVALNILNSFVSGLGKSA